MSHDPSSTLALDRYVLHDPSTGRIRFTPTGRRALFARFARYGIDLRTVQTREAFTDAVYQVAACERRQLPDDLDDNDPTALAVDDLVFVLDALEGRSLRPLSERRAAQARGVEKLINALNDADPTLRL